MFFATKRNVINVEIQAFRNLTYNIARYEHDEGPSIESKNKFHPPVLPLAQQIVFDHPTVKYLPFARSGFLPANTIVPRKLILPHSENSSESIRAKVCDPNMLGVTQRTRSLLRADRQWPKCSEDRFSTPVFDLGIFRPWTYLRCAKEFVWLHISPVF